MNKNIEVINKKLLAVNFSQLKYITEIEYKPDDEVAEHEEFGRVTNDGILILNKAHPAFKILKEWMPKLMKKKDKQLTREINAGQLINSKDDWQIAYAAMLKIESERRTKEKG